MFTRRGYVHSTFVLEFRSVQGCGMDRHGIYDMGRKTSTSIHSSLPSCHNILALCSHCELSGFTKDGSTPERRCTYHDVFSLLATMALLFSPRNHNVSDRTTSDCDVELESYTSSLPWTSRRFCTTQRFGIRHSVSHGSRVLPSIQQVLCKAMVQNLEFTYMSLFFVCNI